MEKSIVTIELMTPMLGTVPKDKEVYATYIATKRELGVDEEEIETVEETEEKGWTGFHTDEKGLFVYDYLVKGFLKNAGNVLKDELKIKNFKSKLSNYCFVFPRIIYLGVDKADGVLERPLRAQTQQGPRVALARSDYLKEGRRITFEIGLLKHKEVSMQTIKDLLSYGELQGLGQFRGGGYGRFRVVDFVKDK